MMQNKIFITAGIVLAIALLLIFFAIAPQIRQIKAAVSSITENRARIEHVQKELAGYQMSHQALSRIRQENVLPQIFPARENMAGLVAGLENAVILSGGAHVLAIVDAKEEEIKNAGSASAAADQKKAEPVVRGLSGVDEVPYELDYTGTYRQSQNFLLEFENLPFPSYIRAITIAAENKQTDEKILRNTGLATVKIEAVFFAHNL